VTQLAVPGNVSACTALTVAPLHGVFAGYDDGAVIAFGGAADKTGRFFWSESMLAGTNVARYDGHKGRITGLAVSMDSLFSCGLDGAVHQFNIKDSSITRTFQAAGPPLRTILLRTRLSLTPEPRDTVWAGGNTGVMHRWDITSGEPVGNSLVISKDQSTIIAAVARKGHVYWADINNRVYDCDASTIGSTVATADKVVSTELPPGVKITCVSHKTKECFIAGSDAAGRPMMQKWKLSHQRNAAIKFGTKINNTLVVGSRTVQLDKIFTGSATEESPPELEYTWKDSGPLGIVILAKGDEVDPTCCFVASLKSNELPRGMQGMLIEEVAGAKTTGKSYDAVLQVIRSAGRPLTIKFVADPELSVISRMEAASLQQAQAIHNQTSAPLSLGGCVGQEYEAAGSPLSPAQRIKMDRDRRDSGGVVLELGEEADIVDAINSVTESDYPFEEMPEPEQAKPTAAELLQVGGAAALTAYLDEHPEEAPRIQDEMRSVRGLLMGTSPRSGFRGAKESSSKCSAQEEEVGFDVELSAGDL